MYNTHFGLQGWCVNLWAPLVYCAQGVAFKSFEDSKENQKCYQMSSFAEKKTNKLAKENLREVWAVCVCGCTAACVAGSRKFWHLLHWL
jgi:hypothetical protein